MPKFLTNIITVIFSKGEGEMEAKALLFDTRSIQRYIYSGNRLKTNIGASYLVDQVFKEVLINKILKGNNGNLGFSPETVDDSRYESESLVDWSRLDKPCTVAYMGGGNALLLFREDTENGIEKKTVEAFSSELLVSRPGLHIGAAFGNLDISTKESFKKGIDDLYLQLKHNQATVFPQVNVPYTGLTLSCEVNGEAANFCDTIDLMGKSEKKESGPRFFSQETAVKTKAEQVASKELRLKFEKLFNSTEVEEAFKNYEFPRALDEMGQKRNEARGNYIAVVHIDGNNMGQKFRLLAEDLEARRRLAIDIKTKTEGSFALLLKDILKQCESGAYKEELELEPKKKGSSISEKKKILPIRPLILGGDDVTFICPAKVALTYTKQLMEILLKEPPEGIAKIDSPAARRMDSCAGIAILPTSYPFFRGYELAEQLCDAAKKSMRRLLKEIPKAQEATATTEDLRGTSWLDFAILHGEQAPTLEQIREREYSGMRGMMHFGPYQVGNTQEASPYNIENLIDCVHQFQKGAKDVENSSTALPMNKIKELRNVLQKGKDEADRFLMQMERLGQKLPLIDDWKDYAGSLWHDKKTPYVDAIEMMDFIPKEV